MTDKYESIFYRTQGKMSTHGLIVYVVEGATDRIYEVL